jgi:ABC-2 type transport system permease protein
MFTPLSFITVLLVALIFSAAASTIGLIIAAVARTEDQAVWISVFVTMATVMMGGTFFEIPADSPLYFMSRISLNTYANDAFKTLIMRGGILGDVVPELIILIAVIAAGFIISRVFFKVMPEGR